MFDFFKDSKTAIEILLIVIPAILLIWYVIGSILSGGAVIKSQKSKGMGEEEADLLYYLPTASLQVKATAKVVITRSIPEESIVDSRLAGLDLENTVLIQPDTSQPILATYESSIFANDDIRISATPQGLLENITVTTEARISNIIGQIVDAPRQMVARESFGPEDKQEEIPAIHTIDQVIEYTRTFTILSSELKKSSFEKPWIISTDGIDASKNTVDATIQFELLTKVSEAHTIGNEKKFNGLLTRPLKKITLNIKTRNKNTRAYSDKPLLEYDVFVPDPDRLVVVPVKRAAFVKNQYAPKFSDGMLIENAITKPSEMEGFLSIPINILKAIVSIPAQLLNFKITRLKQESDLETIQQKLAEQRAAAIKPPSPEKPVRAPAPDTGKPGNDLQQQIIGKLKKTGRFDTLPDNPGKLPAEEPPSGKKIKLQKSILEVAADAGITSLSAPPAISMWQSKVKGNWNSYNNEEKSNCVPAAGAHLIMSWSANALSEMKTPSNDDVQKVFAAVAESQGGGCKIYKFLDNWISPGLFGENINDYVRINKQNIDEAKMGVHYFGGCLVGLQLPALARNRDKWELPTGDLSGDARPGSWGGHAVSILGYYENYFIAVSMGEVVTMSWDFYKAYNDETYIILNKTDWIIPASGQSPEGTSFNILQNSIGALSV